MRKNSFIKLLQYNRELSNKFHSMTKEQMASTKGGHTFREMHATDLRIAEVVTKHPELATIEI